MAYNKIPLALAYDDNTGNASGLVEFTLGLSDVGDVCKTAPDIGQSLVFNGDDWCPSTVATGGGGGGGVTSVNGSAGVVVLTTANINEVTNLYYTNARVTANGSVADNTAKITNVTTDLVEGTATDTTVDVNSSDGTNATLAAASTSRAGVMTKAKFDEVVANNAKVGITPIQASNIATNNGKDTNATHTGDVTGATALTIADDAVTTSKILDDAVTVDKLAPAALTSIAGLTVAEGSIIYATAANTYAVLTAPSGTPGIYTLKINTAATESVAPYWVLDPSP